MIGNNRGVFDDAKNLCTKSNWKSVNKLLAR